jgi:hypothetical protein
VSGTRPGPSGRAEEEEEIEKGTEMSTQMIKSGDVLCQNGEFAIGEAGLKPLLRPSMFFENEKHFLLQGNKR